jgi:hypothetical protein
VINQLWASFNVVVEADNLVDSDPFVSGKAEIQYWLK